MSNLEQIQAIATENTQAIASLRQATNDLLQTQISQGEAIDKLLEGQMAMQVLQGQLVEQTLQLKRAMDYLLSNDGEN